jgi:hypothetical protein
MIRNDHELATVREYVTAAAPGRAHKATSRLTLTT